MNLRLKRNLSIICHNKDMVELRQGVFNTTSIYIEDDDKKGKLSEVLLYMNGEFKLSEIAKKVKISRVELEKLVDILLEKGVLEDRSSNLLDYYIESQLVVNNINNSLSKKYEKNEIVIFSNGKLSQKIIHSLAELEVLNRDIVVQVINTDDKLYSIIFDKENLFHQDSELFYKSMESFENLKNKFVIFIQNNIDLLATEKLSYIANEIGCSYMMLSIDGPMLLIGPTVIPKRTACYKCFEKRIMMNLSRLDVYKNYKNALIANQVYEVNSFIEPVAANILISHGISEILNFIFTGSNFTLNKVLTIYLPTMELSFREILRLPNCEVCAPNNITSDSELHFELKKLIKEII